MSEIGTHKQRVDPENFNQHFDETFKRSGNRPGKTTYVMRNGKMMTRAEADALDGKIYSIEGSVEWAKYRDWLKQQYRPCRLAIG